MMEKLRSIMLGRAGLDALSIALAILFLVIATFGQMFNNVFVRWISLIPLAFCVARSFSRNIGKRSGENDKFLLLWQGVLSWGRGIGGRFRDSGTYRFYACPKCGQKMRVPKGRGKVEITCPRCKNMIIRKT